jgi:hypothetical protein
MIRAIAYGLTGDVDRGLVLIREAEGNLHRSDPLIADMAIAHGDDHAIKFAEACLREHAITPSTTYLAAARRAVDLLVPA